MEIDLRQLTFDEVAKLLKNMDDDLREFDLNKVEILFEIFFTGISNLFITMDYKNVIDIFKDLKKDNVINRISLKYIINNDKVEYNKKQLLLELKEKKLLDDINIFDLLQYENLLDKIEYLIESDCEQCPICYQNKCNIKIRCDKINHKFCHKCISKMLNQNTSSKCPICRKDIYEIYFNFL